MYIHKQYTQTYTHTHAETLHTYNTKIRVGAYAHAAVDWCLHPTIWDGALSAKLTVCSMIVFVYMRTLALSGTYQAQDHAGLGRGTCGPQEP